MIVLFIEEYNGYYNVTNNGKTKIRIDEQGYTLVATENPNEFEATPIEGYIPLCTQKEHILSELNEAKVYEGTTEGDAEIARCKQAYIDLCGGTSVETKTQVVLERDEAQSDAEKFLNIIMESEGVW